MARSATSKMNITYKGEVWTDACGRAIVALPDAPRGWGPLEYELSPIEPGVTATIASEFGDGRFTIATDEPHVKVAWRVREKRRDGGARAGQSRKEKK
jgi:hypothetical protein